MSKNKFELVFFDLIGTLVYEKQANGSIIIDTFAKTFKTVNIHPSYEELNMQRGKSKKEAIRSILDAYNETDDLTDTLYNRFMNELYESLNLFTEIEGSSQAFEHLQNKGIKIALGSGLPGDFANELLKHLGWQQFDFDYIGSSEELGKGRPDPVMINDAIKKLHIKERKNILKVGDTIADIQEGKNAGVITASVLTGTQPRHELEKYKPDYILNSIKDIISIL